MKSTTKKIELLVKEINQLDTANKNDKRNDIIIVLTFSFDTFYKRCFSVSNFFKILTNGKNTLTGMKSNREWFKSLDVDGFYRYNITRDIVELIMVISTSKKMNELEFKSRVRKIIKPLNVVISYNDNYLLNKKFIDVFSIETGMALFGGHKKNNLLK